MPIETELLNRTIQVLGPVQCSATMSHTVGGFEARVLTLLLLNGASQLDAGSTASMLGVGAASGSEHFKAARIELAAALGDWRVRFARGKVWLVVEADTFEIECVNVGSHRESQIDRSGELLRAIKQLDAREGPDRLRLLEGVLDQFPDPRIVVRTINPWVLQCENARALVRLLIEQPNGVDTRTLCEAIHGGAVEQNQIDAMGVAIGTLNRRFATQAAPFISHVSGVYQLCALTSANHDVLTFREKLRRAQSAARGGEHEEVYRLAGEALNLWRGHPFFVADCVDEHLDDLINMRALRANLHTERAEAIGLSAEALVRLGRLDDAQELVADLKRGWAIGIYEYERSEVLCNARMLLAWHAGDVAEADRLYRNYCDAAGLAPDRERSIDERWKAISANMVPDGWRASSPTRAEPAGLRLIGRSREVSQLRGSLNRGGDGRKLVLICGGLGYGKSRLLSEIATMQHASSTVLQCRAGTAAYSLVRGLLADLARRLNNDFPRLKPGDTIREILPEIFQVSTGAPSSLGRRQAICRSVAAYLAVLDEPIVLIDDADAADADSCELLLQLGQDHNLSNLQFVAVVHGSPNEIVGPLREVVDAYRAEDCFEVITLDPLNSADSEALHQAAHPYGPTLDDVREETGGVPRLLVLGMSDLRLFQGMAASLRSLLEHASIFDSEFTTRDLEALLGADFHTDTLSEAMEAGFLAWNADGKIRFRSDSFREAILGQLGLRSIDLHRLALDRLEAADCLNPEQRARHVQGAALSSRVEEFEAHYKAGVWLASLSAYSAAKRHFELADRVQTDDASVLTELERVRFLREYSERMRHVDEEVSIAALHRAFQIGVGLEIDDDDVEDPTVVREIASLADTRVVRDVTADSAIAHALQRAIKLAGASTPADVLCRLHARLAMELLPLATSTNDDAMANAQIAVGLADVHEVSMGARLRALRSMAAASEYTVAGGEYQTHVTAFHELAERANELDFLLIAYLSRVTLACRRGDLVDAERWLDRATGVNAGTAWPRWSLNIAAVRAEFARHRAQEVPRAVTDQIVQVSPQAAEAEAEIILVGQVSCEAWHTHTWAGLSDAVENVASKTRTVVARCALALCNLTELAGDGAAPEQMQEEITLLSAEVGDRLELLPRDALFGPALAFLSQIAFIAGKSCRHRIFEAAYEELTSSTGAFGHESEYLVGGASIALFGPKELAIAMLIASGNAPGAEAAALVALKQASQRRQLLSREQSHVDRLVDELGAHSVS